MSLEDLDANAHIIKLLEISEHNAEGEDDHGQNGEVEVVADGDLVGEPDDEERVDPDPKRGAHQRQRIELLFALGHRIRHRHILQQLVGKQDHVHYFVAHTLRHLQETLLVLVDIFQDQVIDESLSQLHRLGMFFVLLPLQVPLLFFLVQI